MSAPHVLEMVRALEVLGVGSTSVCHAVGLHRSELRNAAARIPASIVVALFAEAERRTGDPLVGLHAGERANAREVLVYLVMAHPRLEDGLRQLERFSHLPLDTMRIRLTREFPNASLSVDLGMPPEDTRQLIDYVLAAIVCNVRRSVVADFPLREVRVRHAGWSEPAEAARLFGCPVRSNQPENRLVFPIRKLQAVSRVGNALIAAQIEKFAAAQSADLARAATFGERVESVIRALLTSSVPADRLAVARRLHVSRRTLQRRLADEGTTFKAVRDTVRWEVVEALCSNPVLSIKAIALTVGFADVAGFSKAFRRRTGYSPTQYRNSPSRRRAGHGGGTWQNVAGGMGAVDSAPAQGEGRPRRERGARCRTRSNRTRPPSTG